jgi:hypothetical protein
MSNSSLAVIPSIVKTPLFLAAWSVTTPAYVRYSNVGKDIPRSRWEKFASQPIPKPAPKPVSAADQLALRVAEMLAKRLEELGKQAKS